MTQTSGQRTCGRHRMSIRLRKGELRGVKETDGDGVRLVKENSSA